LNVLYDGADVDVLLITGMRDEAPVAAFSHLAAACRMLEVVVKASKETQLARGGCQGSNDSWEDSKNGEAINACPDFTFNNDATGDEGAKRFAERSLLPFFHEDLQRLAVMARPVSDFPRPGVEFRDVLGISQKPGGLTLCTSLLQTHFTGDWAKVNAVACCEAGSFIYASALAARVNVPLALIREAGKLPPPTISANKSPSHISSSASIKSKEDTKIEIGRDVIPEGASVVVVDDVLATGRTLCAVLQLLHEAGVSAEDVNVMVVAEFPVHRGRELLRRHGFGRVKFHSLLVFGGA